MAAIFPARNGGIDVGDNGTNFIDLRSDTVTAPTEAMRRAMAAAEVGDDVLGADPTAAALEERAAALLGKEAALFFPSGTMANLTALMVHAGPGTEVYLGGESHIYYYEAGGLTRVAGLFPRLFDDGRGMPEPDAVEALLRPDNVHFPRPGLLCLENTHNRAGGAVADAARTASVAAAARAAGVPVHLDGARLFNAAAALGVEPKTLAEPVDSVMVSLSKALSAPVGSLVAGSKQFIAEARRVRKLLGGGMRQVGVIAAAGLVALETSAASLRRQHEVAKSLATGLAEIEGVFIDPEAVQSNIVLFRLTVPEAEPPGSTSGTGATPAPATRATPAPADELVARLAERGIGAVTMDRDLVRFVTHRHIEMAVVPTVLAAVRDALSVTQSGAGLRRA